MRRCAGGSLEGLSEMMRAQARLRGQVAQADVLGEVCFDVVDDAPQAQRAESADHRRRAAEPLAIGTEDMHGERRPQPLSIEPPARAAFELGRAQCRERVCPYV